MYIVLPEYRFLYTNYYQMAYSYKEESMLSFLLIDVLKEKIYAFVLKYSKLKLFNKFFLFKMFEHSYLSVCVYLCEYAMFVLKRREYTKSLELEIKDAVNPSTRVWGVELETSEKVAITLKHWAIFSNP